MCIYFIVNRMFIQERFIHAVFLALLFQFYMISIIFDIDALTNIFIS